jgi:hypothetical protein
VQAGLLASISLAGRLWEAAGPEVGGPLGALSLGVLTPALGELMWSGADANGWSDVLGWSLAGTFPGALFGLLSVGAALAAEQGGADDRMNGAERAAILASGAGLGAAVGALIFGLRAAAGSDPVLELVLSWVVAVGHLGLGFALAEALGGSDRHPAFPFAAGATGAALGVAIPALLGW